MGDLTPLAVFEAETGFLDEEVHLCAFASAQSRSSALRAARFGRAGLPFAMSVLLEPTPYSPLR